MSNDHFAVRMAEIRRRFAARFAAKIVDTELNLADLAGDDAIAAVKASYQRYHEIAGIAPTIGFPETGKAARALDALLLGPYRDGRALTPDELAKAREGLEALCAAARVDFQSIDAEFVP